MKYLILLLLSVLPAVLFLFQPGYYNMHDDMQMIRQLEMEKCFIDGQIPCRWGPDLGYGYGYPIFNFYPPLPYLVGQGIRLLGFSFVDTVKLAAILQFYFAALAMFFLVKKLISAKTGYIAALFYTYAPYHFTNIYIRGAFNEAWASVFFPLVFLFTYNLAVETKNIWRNVVLLSFSIAGVLLSHNPMVLLIAPFTAIWTLFWIIKNRSFKSILPLLTSALLSISISAFYTLPVIFETKYVQIESMFSNYYSFVAHFTSLWQLFLSSYWGNGPSFFGPKDGMSFSVGYLHWLIPVLTSFYILLVSIKKRTLDNIQKMLLILTSFALISLFLSHERSGFIWERLSLLQKIQFPWRLLNISTFFLSLASSLSLYLLEKKPRLKYLSFFTLLGLFLINYSLAKPLQFGPLTDEEKFSGRAWNNQITSGIYDYLPKAARIAPRGPAGSGIDEIFPQDAFGGVLNTNSGSDWNLISLNLKKPAQVFLSRFDFPGTAVYNNLQKVEHTNEPELGRISLSLPAGENLIYVKLENTPIRKISNLISISILLLICLATIWKKRLVRT